MKRQFLFLVAIAVFTTALATNASGQTGKTLRSNVEFDFQIGDRLYPAGAYRIELMSGANVLLITSAGDTNKKQIILAGYSEGSKGQMPKLVFQKYGENHFLTQISFGDWAYSILPSRRQRESETTLASRLPRTN